MIKSVLLVALIFLAGCAPTPEAVQPPTEVIPAPYGAHVAVRLDPSMEPYAEQLLDAARIWEPLGGFLELDDQAAKVIICAAADDPLIASDGGTGLAYENGAGITVDCGLAASLIAIEQESLEPGQTPMPPNSGVTALLAHELGHLYGLPHETTDPKGLMYPSGCCAESAILTNADLADWYAVHPKI